MLTENQSREKSLTMLFAATTISPSSAPNGACAANTLTRADSFVRDGKPVRAFAVGLRVSDSLMRGSSVIERRALRPEVGGSIPPPAPNLAPGFNLSTGGWTPLKSGASEAQPSHALPHGWSTCWWQGAMRGLLFVAEWLLCSVRFGWFACYGRPLVLRRGAAFFL